MEAAEMKLRGPLGGYTLLENIYNEEIHDELNFADIIVIITANRNRWSSQILGMDSDRIPLKVQQ
jgi:hypothetical protein